MKWLTSLFIMLICCANVLFADHPAGIAPYVLEDKGDVLLIKDFFDNEAQNLQLAILGDTTATGDVFNENRVYQLKRGGWYPGWSSFNLTSEREVRIIGEEGPADMELPLISLYLHPTEGETWEYFHFFGKALIKNVRISPIRDNETFNWLIMRLRTGSDVTFDNCIFEYAWWKTFHVDWGERECKQKFINNTALNMCGHEKFLFKGGLVRIKNPLGEFYFENNTIFNCIGYIIEANYSPIAKFYFNHNTIVNNAGHTLQGLDYAWESIITNNLWVNSCFFPYFVGNDSEHEWLTAGLHHDQLADYDFLPRGIVTIDTMVTDKWDDTAKASMPAEADRKFLVANNAVYWDPKFYTMLTDLQTTYPQYNLQSQLMTMNDRSQAMFDDDANYPFLIEKNWYEGIDPDFANYPDVNDTWINRLTKAFSEVPEVEETGIQGSKDLAYRINRDDYLAGDWPLPFDFSYSNATLLQGSTNSGPVGDLNWFDDEIAAFDAEAEYNSLVNMMETSVESNVSTPAEFRLSQNFPNPFNPTTTIAYSLKRADHVKLSVYNMLGQHIRTLVNSQLPAGSHEVQWDGTNLNGVNVVSGVYFYKLKIGDKSQINKMLMVK